MPGIFDHSMSRRDFARQMGATVTVLALGSRTRGEDAPADGAHLALLSDTHISADPQGEYRKFRPWDNLKAVVPQVIQAAPEVVILSGDAARLSGELEDYRAVQDLMRPLAERMPVLIGLGNHDDRSNFFKVFAEDARRKPLVKDRQILVVERPQLRIVVLDSLLYVNRVAGLLGKSQRQWLAQCLDNSDGRPTVLFVHHTLGDGDSDLLDTEKLFALLRPHPKVKAIFYGHSHAYNLREEQGIHLVNVPAVGYNFADAEPVGWVDAEFTAQGVSLVLRAIGGNRRQDGERTTLRWSKTG